MNGAITKEEIKEARNKRKMIEQEGTEKNIVTNKEQMSNEELESGVLRLSLLGISDLRIINILKKEYKEIKRIQQDLISKGKISQEEIEEKINERRQKDKNIVCTLFKEGYTYKEIAKAIPYANTNYVARIVEELKKEGQTTDEQIGNIKFERNERYKREVILDGLQRGLTHNEMEQNYEKKVKDIKEVTLKTITKKMICEYTSKLITQNVITKEEIEKQRKEWNRIKLNEKKEQHVGIREEKVLELFKLGFCRIEIAKLMNLSTPYISQVKVKLKQKGKITEEEIQSAIENRQNEAKKRQTHIAKMISFSKKIDENIIQTHLDYAKVAYKLDELKNKDIKLLRKVIPMDAKLVSFDSVNFILRVLTKQNNDTQAIEFIDECMLACEEDKKMCEKLQETRTQIENKIIQLKEKGRRRQQKSKIITHPQSPKDGLSAGDGWEH